MPLAFEQSKWRHVVADIKGFTPKSLYSMWKSKFLHQPVLSGKKLVGYYRQENRWSRRTIHQCQHYANPVVQRNRKYWTIPSVLWQHDSESILSLIAVKVFLFCTLTDQSPQRCQRSGGCLHSWWWEHGARNPDPCQLPTGPSQGGEWKKGRRWNITVAKLDASADNVFTSTQPTKCQLATHLFHLFSSFFSASKRIHPWRVDCVEEECRQTVRGCGRVLHLVSQLQLSYFLLFNVLFHLIFSFYILHGANHQLPKLACRTCKKKFHSACLYKWFSTSNNSTCPLCRNLF